MQFRQPTHSSSSSRHLRRWSPCHPGSCSKSRQHQGVMSLVWCVGIASCCGCFQLLNFRKLRRALCLSIASLLQHAPVCAATWHCTANTAQSCRTCADDSESGGAVPAACRTNDICFSNVPWHQCVDGMLGGCLLGSLWKPGTAFTSSTCPGRHMLKRVLRYAGHLAHSLRCSRSFI